MYNFDGDYRRRPIQNLGGVSLINDRETLIRKVQQERQKRNELRKQNNGATIIQSYTRSFLIRQHAKQNERENFNKFWLLNKEKLLTTNLNNDDNIIKVLSYLLKRLLFFYMKSNKDDCDKLVNICKVIIKNPQKILENCLTESVWLHRMKKLLVICLEQLTITNNIHTIPMRTLETFLSYNVIQNYIKCILAANPGDNNSSTASKSINEHNDDNTNKLMNYFNEMYEYLIKNAYYSKLRSIFENKCPPLNDDDYIVNAPNQLTDAIYQLIIGPLLFVNNLNDTITAKNKKHHTCYHHNNGTISNLICLSFIKEFLLEQYTQPIYKYLIPSLSINKKFPFKIFIQSLCLYNYFYNCNNNNNNNNNNSNDNSSNSNINIFYNNSNINDSNYDDNDINKDNHEVDNDDCKMNIDEDEYDNRKQHFKIDLRSFTMNLNSTFLLYAILNLDKIHFDEFNNKSLLSGYIKNISFVLPRIQLLPKTSRRYKIDVDNVDSTDSEEDDDNYDKNVIKSNLMVLEKECLLKSIELLNESERVSIITDNIDLILGDAETMYSLCKICHDLMIFNKSAIFDYKLLYTLAFMPKFLRSVWFTLASQSSQLGFSSPLSLLSKGVVPKANIDIDRTIPFLATFCALFGRLVPTLHDGEFCEGNNFIILPTSLPIAAATSRCLNTTTASTSLMPFTLPEVIQLSKTLKEISLGLVELAFPETRSNLNEHYRSVFNHHYNTKNDNLHYDKITKLKWTNLLKVVVSVLNQIHTRDLRRNFCPNGHWIIQTLNLPLDRPNDLPLTRGNRRGLRPFQPIHDFTREDFENGPPMSTKQIRSITILREIPFVVPFNTRVSILQGLIAANKIQIQGDLQGFLQGPSIQITVRRSYLYEDAYDKLRPENEPDLRHKFRVQFINNLNLEEAGIDGGGLFREFLSELIKTAFDPNRGFFMVTTDNKLYPNPSVGDLIPDFEKHYYFMGRILGKAIYENLLVELPLAEFFLSKLAGKYSDVDVHQLESLDPELYRNLLSLKEYDGDVSDLNVDFTVVSNDLGTTKIKELKPNGQLIQVTSSNRIEYIQLMADYKLNKQIRQHCIAFRNGLSNVLPVEWLYMFSNKELQILISGAEIPINLDDLKLHCRYGGEYGPQHPTIQCFWKVVEEFTDIQKRQLLKFVTSCSRPPLLGFKDLDPPFSIQNAGDEERLPTASTCTNLLKLPSFKTIEQMREKLLYAIQAGAGFDLS